MVYILSLLLILAVSWGLVCSAIERKNWPAAVAICMFFVAAVQIGAVVFISRV